MAVSTIGSFWQFSNWARNRLHWARACHCDSTRRIFESGTTSMASRQWWI